MKDYGFFVLLFVIIIRSKFYKNRNRLQRIRPNVAVFQAQRINWHIFITNWLNNNNLKSYKKTTSFWIVVLSFPLCESGLFFIHSFSMKIWLWLLVIRCLHNGWNANRLNERRFVDGRGSFLSALTSTAKKEAREKDESNYQLMIWHKFNLIPICHQKGGLNPTMAIFVSITKLRTDFYIKRVIFQAFITHDSYCITLFSPL